MFSCTPAQELLPRTFAKFATPVDNIDGALLPSSVCVLDLLAYRQLVGAVFAAGVPGMEAEDAGKGWPWADDPHAVAPSVYRLSTASFQAVRSYPHTEHGHSST